MPVFWHGSHYKGVKQRSEYAILFFNWDSLTMRHGVTHNSHYEAWSYKKKEAQKD